ncbi:MAG: hypothetical protein GYB68_13935, partial [Chloroflexi bacterium]|nr:hypothetical protein [Chloroflexota bacterium]
AGVASYPTLLYEYKGQRMLIARGYLAPEEAVERVALQRRGAQTAP